MKFPRINTDLIVILGYCLLVTLAITGFIRIYYEVIKSYQQTGESSKFTKELIDLNNTLTTMYQAEGTASLLAFAENEQLKYEFYFLNRRVFIQIDSLRAISTDPVVISNLDELTELLIRKRENTLQMFELIKLTDKKIIDEIKKVTVITSNDVSKLNALLTNVTYLQDDTTQILAERRNFLRRLGDVFSPSSQDSLTKVTRSSFSESMELLTPLLVDSIVEFFTEFNKYSQQKNVLIFKKLIAHQNEMYNIKELTTLKINKIVDTLKENEYLTGMALLNEKNNLLKKSTKLVAFIGLFALIVAVFFISWTLYSLKKARQLQQNIQEANKYTEKLLLSREQLIYTITHDVKAPLSSIIGFLDLMSDDKPSEKQQYYINNMHSATSHILDLARNLWDFHSIEKEQPKLNNVVFIPASLIQNIYDSFLPLAQKKKLNFELNYSINEKKVFLSDPYYIRQIVNNLISNAIKYTPEGGSIYLITSLDEQDVWKISVIDNGLGIDYTDQDKIFEEFVRLNSTKNEVEGTGLGLTISKKLAFLLGGNVELESQKGVGSTFILTVPLKSFSKDNSVQQDVNQNASSVRVMFVDDDNVQLNLLSEIMKREGLSGVCCSRAYEALSILRKKSFDIVFTDLHIPDLEGLELLKLIRQSDSPEIASIPVIAFSASGKETESKLKEVGFNEFLLKPFKVQELLEIIEKYTSFKRETHDIYSSNEDLEWNKIMDFAAGNQEAALKILDSFIKETKKDREDLFNAVQNYNNEAIKEISHKMLTLMRMISSEEIISLLVDFEKGNITKEKKKILFYLLDETIKEAELTRMKVVKN